MEAAIKKKVLKNDYFWAYCEKEPNTPNELESIYIIQFTFDQITYYQVEQKERYVDHELIKGNMTNLKANSAGGYKHCRINYYDKDGCLSEACKKYLTLKDNELRFLFGGKVLKEVNLYKSVTNRPPNLGNLPQLKLFDSEEEPDSLEDNQIVQFDNYQPQSSLKRIKTSTLDFNSKTIAEQKVTTILDNLPNILKSFSKFKLFNTIVLQKIK